MVECGAGRGCTDRRARRDAPRVKRLKHYREPGAAAIGMAATGTAITATMAADTTGRIMVGITGITTAGTIMEGTTAGTTTESTTAAIITEGTTAAITTEGTMAATIMEVTMAVTTA